MKRIPSQVAVARSLLYVNRFAKACIRKKNYASLCLVVLHRIFITTQKHMEETISHKLILPTQWRCLPMSPQKVGFMQLLIYPVRKKSATHISIVLHYI